jgi:hypothetical protein
MALVELHPPDFPWRHDDPKAKTLKTAIDYYSLPSIILYMTNKEEN